jgi:hypothetical protein
MNDWSGYEYHTYHTSQRVSADISQQGHAAHHICDAFDPIAAVNLCGHF